MSDGHTVTHMLLILVLLNVEPSEPIRGLLYLTFIYVAVTQLHDKVSTWWEGRQAERESSG